jgi:GNAT superfamily N-acetyltransferase
MTVLAAPYAIEEVDLPALPEHELLAVARLQLGFGRERVPEDPEPPIELIVRRLRTRAPVMKARDWLVRDGADVVASAQLTRWDSAENPHWRDGWILVAPEHRRRGIARALLAGMVRAAGESDDIVIGSWVNSRIPAGNDFARAVGATEGLNNRTSRTTLAEIDRALVAEWAHLDPSGYRLIWIDEDVPDEHMDRVIAAYDLMNTAPRGDLAFGDWHVTAEEIRQWDAVRKKTGGEHRLLLASHEATGAAVGFTETNRHPETPWIIGQQGTAVDPAHRGHGIGKWIKAAMIERIWREWPDARVIQTGNAYSNAPMLSINDRLGFKEVWSTIVWQLKITDARRYLEARGL